MAAIIRNKEGKIRTVTNHHMVGAGATWGMFWGMLFGMLFFVPFFGMAVGAGMGALMGKIGKSAVDKQFQDQVREMLQPGTSALFMVVEGDPGQGRGGDVQVRRHRAQEFPVQ